MTLKKVDLVNIYIKMKLTQEQIFGIVRHIMTGVGAILIAKGKVDESAWTLVTGSVLGVVGIVWSVLSKNQ